MQEVEAPRFQDSRHKKVVSLAALLTGRLYTPESTRIPGTHFLDAESTPGPKWGGRDMSMKNSNNNIENQTSDLPTYIAILA
jgi:hypothetical protein